ncbi:MAG: SCO family protein [Gammaproteobacteria bacterium]
MKNLSLICFSLLILSLYGCDQSDNEAEHKAVVASFENQVQLHAPGWGDMQFKLPEPGTYKLPPFGKAADGNVLTDEGEEKRLSDFYGDKVVLLSFMFTQCSDLNGCPLVTAVYYKLKEALKNDPELSDQLRLVSLSFDPKYDTPEVMKFYGQGSEDFGGPEWQFLTTASEKELTPITQEFGQYVNQEYDEEGNPTNSFAHILRVFLIDKEGRKRTQYSASFLHDQSIITDLKTLLLEEQGK